LLLNTAGEFGVVVCKGKRFNREAHVAKRLKELLWLSDTRNGQNSSAA
jgi:hypothetical protein